MGSTKLKTPPIQEAICGFSLKKREEEPWDTSLNGLLLAQLGDRYTGPRRQQEVPTDEGVLERSLFASADETQLIGIGDYTLSIHSLSPYEGWESFLPRIEETWAAFERVAKGQEIKAASLKYVNAIKLPGLIDNWDEYFTAPLTIQPGLSESVKAYFSGAVSHPEGDSSTTLTQFWAIVPDDGELMLSLHLEVAQAFEPHMDVDKMRAVLNRLHKIEVDRFFASLKTKAMEAYNNETLET